MTRITAPRRLFGRAVCQIVVIIAVWFLPVSHYLRDWFDVSISPLGHFNGIAVTTIVLWILEDSFTRRRAMYGRYGFLEPRPIYALRHIRIAIAILLSLAALASALRVHMYPFEGEDWRFWSTIGILSSAGIAAAGWITTNLQSQLTTRIAETENALRDMFQDHDMIQIKKYTSVIYNYWRDDAGLDCAISVDKLEMSYANLLRRKYSTDLVISDVDLRVNHDRSCRDFIGEYLNVLDRIALGIRTGRLDFVYSYEALVNVVIRTYEKWARVLEDESSPQTVEFAGIRCQSSSEKTFENFIWLAWHFRRRLAREQSESTRTAVEGMIRDLRMPIT